jgi:flagellar hook protein FlgE
MYAAISGMKAHMQKLNVIGNNISNINTPAYKASQALFRESIYTTITSGSNGSASAGGVNPSQLGYGCSLGSVAMDMSTADFSADGNGMHCMIDGNGFFLTGSKPTATVDGDGKTTLAETDPQNLELGRVGDFKFDPQGYLVDGGGHVIYGFVTYTANPKDGDNALTTAEKGTPPVSKQLVPIRLPIAAASNDGSNPAGTALYPKLDDTSKMNVYPKGSGNTINPDSIAIDKATGKITANNSDGSIVVVGYLALGTVANPDGVTRLENGYYKAGEGAGNCSATSIGGAVEGYLNNKEKDDADAVAVLSAGKTALLTGGLESSGTDLATEIAEMITTQRGYQANTRIITVTDTMLEELVNMKR